MNQKYATVKIPVALASEIDDFRKETPHFRSRAEVVVTAIREFLAEKIKEDS